MNRIIDIVRNVIGAAFIYPLPLEGSLYYLVDVLTILSIAVSKSLYVKKRS